MFEDDMFNHLDDTEKEEIKKIQILLEKKREVWHTMANAGFVTLVRGLVEKDDEIDLFLFMLVHDSLALGKIIELPNIPSIVMDGKNIDAESHPSLLLDTLTIRSLLTSAFMYGIYYKSKLDELDSMWKHGTEEET